MVAAAVRIVLVLAMIVGVGVSTVAAATDTTEPSDPTADDDDAATDIDVDGSVGSMVTQGFCDALIDFESALISEDPDLINVAIDDLFTAVPDAPTAAAVDEVLATIGFGTFDPAYIEAHTALIDHAQATCDYAEIYIEAWDDHEFRELPDQVDAGSTVFVFHNNDVEHHHLWIGHIPEDEDIEEILRLPEEERNQYRVTQTIAGPTDTSKAGPIDLVPGRHVAACFMPVDASSGMVADILATGTIPDDAGQRHWELGMLAEFYVT